MQNHSTSLKKKNSIISGNFTTNYSNSIDDFIFLFFSKRLQWEWQEATSNIIGIIKSV